MTGQPKRFARLLLAATLLAALAVCGYVRSGRWEDDPKNWDRTGAGPLPSGWQVVHSLVWRYPHFTYEGGYYLQVRVTGEGRRLLVQPDYVRLKPEDAALSGPCEARPRWFAPKDPAAYEIWGAAGGTGNYRLLIDPASSDVFFAECRY